MVLGPFCDMMGPSLSADELDAFERLLEAQDQDIYNWIIGREPAPPPEPEAENDGEGGVEEAVEPEDAG